MIKVNLLPKNLRKRVEPGYWRLAAIGFFLLAGAVVGLQQYNLSLSIAEAQRREAELRREVAELQVFVRREQALRSEQGQLQQIVAIDRQIREGTITWSTHLLDLLATLPRRPGGAPLVAISGITATPGDLRADQAIFDRQALSAQFNITGVTFTAADVATLVRAFENSPIFAVNFQNTAQAGGEGGEQATFNFTIGVGVIVRDETVMDTPTTAQAGRGSR